MTAHFSVVFLQVAVFLAASLLLVRKGNQIGPRFMLGAVTIEIISAPIVWAFSDQINLHSRVWIPQALWTLSTLGVAVGLLVYALEKKPNSMSGTPRDPSSSIRANRTRGSS